MIEHSSITPTELRKLIRTGKLTLAGNQRLKIYGRFDCSSGKRMKKENRVFFANEEEALNAGYRPCGNCLRERYLIWRVDNKSLPVKNTGNAQSLVQVDPDLFCPIL